MLTEVVLPWKISTPFKSKEYPIPLLWDVVTISIFVGNDQCTSTKLQFGNIRTLGSGIRDLPACCAEESDGDGDGDGDCLWRWRCIL